MQDEVLVKAITAELEANPGGLVEREIRQAVLKTTGLRRRPPEIRQTLQENRELFVGPLANGRWRLKAVIETEEIVTSDLPPENLRQERGEVVTPFLAHLPQLDSFIAFDLLCALCGFAVNNDSIHCITQVFFPHHNEIFLRNLSPLSRETVVPL